MQIKTIEVAGHPGYFVRSNGDVIGKRGKPMIGHVDRCGYREVLFYEHGKTNQYRVHRLMLENFCPVDGMEKLQVNHKNGNKTDNRIENLEWCTRSENLLHAYKHGLERKVTGTNHHAHVLSKEALEDIRSNCHLRCKGMSAAHFARKYHCHYDTIIRVVKGVSYVGD